MRRTFEILVNHFTTNIMVLRTIWTDTKRQSRIIFVEMYLKNKTIGAEHRDIIPDNQFNQLVFAKDK